MRLEKDKDKEFLTNNFINKVVKEEGNSGDNFKSESCCKKIIIQGKNKNEEFLINCADLIYVKASGNYLRILSYVKETDEVKIFIVRNSLSTFSEQIKECHSIIKVHRSYLVNLDYIASIKGPIKNFKIQFKESLHLQEIPVARSKVFEVKEIFQSLKKK